MTLVKASVLLIVIVVGFASWREPVAAKQPDVGADDIVWFDTSGEPLADSVRILIQGKKKPDGRCAFEMPALQATSVRPELMARQTMINRTRCLTEVEIGIPSPVDVVYPDDGAALATEPMTPAHRSSPEGAGRSFSALSAGCSVGDYRVWWDDVAHIKVTDTHSEVNWCYDGYYVTSGYGVGRFWWRSGTGWSLYQYFIQVTYQYGYTRLVVDTDATYLNSSFCAGQNVWNYLDDVTAEGLGDGNLMGWVNDTWVDEPWWCPPLHWHSQIHLN